MKLEIAEGGTRTLVDVPDGLSTVGGAPTDRIQVKGAPPRWLNLAVEAGQVIVEGRRPFLVGRVWCPAARRRLLVAGESIHLGDRAWLRNPGDARVEVPRSGARTEAVARELLGALDAPPSRAGTLQCLTGLDLGRTYPLADGITELGRGESAGVRIRDRHVSRRHARLVPREGALTIEDQGTANGVVLNGRRIARPQPVVDGDLIELGTTLLRYRGPAQEPPPAPPPAVQPAPEPAPDPESAGSPPGGATGTTAEAQAAGVDPQAETDELPILADAPARHGRRPRLDAALLLAGVALALAGMLVTWSASVSRESAPARRDPPAAPSAAGAARRSW